MTISADKINVLFIIKPERTAGAELVLLEAAARLIPQEAQYMYDVVHLNTAGSKLAARLISEQLQPLVNAKK